MRLKDFIQPFSDNETREIECKLSRDDVQRLTEMHKEKLEILEGLEHFDGKINIAIENINSIAGTFPNLRKELVRDIDVYKACINRLWERYFRV